ncbi:MAG: hypothetical protein CMF69_05485 [Magnetovibrio sp.]|nr:hypothetical protein [Magnetovibrio sp.]|tara:strand:- start:950 stop:1672 length:723 start_codon:yes stop_codon:yes gene_type:complete
MSLIKQVLQSTIIRCVSCWIGAQYIRFVHATTRWQIFGADIPRTFWEKNEPFILAFWHGRLLMMPHCWDQEKPIHMLISGHRDGLLIANTVAHFGIKTVSGSSSKGGASALRTMVKMLKAGEYVGITPDGPRGPRMHTSKGIITVAKLSGAPIIPTAFATSNGRNLKSWDQFLLAWPFSKGVIVWGDPIEVSSKADEKAVEQARKCVENSLNTITAQADQLTGRKLIEAEQTMALSKKDR